MRPDDIPIRVACDQAWTSMTPTAQGRHCPACERTVHDLSTMTAAQVRAFMRARTRRGARFCISYRVDAGGDVIVRPPNVVPARRLVRAAAMTTALAACAPYDDSPLPPGLDSDVEMVEALAAPPVEVVPTVPPPPEAEPDAELAEELVEELPPPPALEADEPEPHRRRSKDTEVRYLGWG